ncbi:MAG: HD-GYP domain-containing protein [Lachnospiraceae bacterium]|nr:HD-GYP domain-containing protein [Lachnospiraceae bacterium]
MRYVPLRFVKSGMVLGQDIYDGAGRLLLAKHLLLNDEYLNSLEVLGFPGVYIDDEYSEDVEIREVIRPEVKREALSIISKMFVEEEDTFPGGIDVVVSKIVDNVLDNADVMCNMLDIKKYDDYTYFHSVNVGILAAMVGAKMGLLKDQLMDLTTAGLLHDVGKKFVPVEILNSSEKLTDEEMEIIRSHPRLGADFIREKYAFSSYVNQGILQHHEWFDGNGYPLGRRGEEIPVYARIISLVDVYDALTSTRPYRSALPNSEAVEFIMGSGGSQFDPVVVDAFIHKIAIYPLGSQVELSDGRQAIVVKNDSKMILRPVVRVMGTRTDLDLANDPEARNITILKIII